MRLSRTSVYPGFPVNTLALGALQTNSMHDLSILRIFAGKRLIPPQVLTFSLTWLVASSLLSLRGDSFSFEIFSKIDLVRPAHE